MRCACPSVGVPHAWHTTGTVHYKYNSELWCQLQKLVNYLTKDSTIPKGRWAGGRCVHSARHRASALAKAQGVTLSYYLFIMECAHMKKLQQQLLGTEHLPQQRWKTRKTLADRVQSSLDICNEWLELAVDLENNKLKCYFVLHGLRKTTFHCFVSFPYVTAAWHQRKQVQNSGLSTWLNQLDFIILSTSFMCWFWRFNLNNQENACSSFE